MKNVFTLGIVALIAVIGFVMISCGDGNGGGDAPDLPGTITITPTAATVGTKLTANYSGTEDVSYQWKHGASNVGLDSDEFTPNAVGSYTVTVSAAGFKPKTSAAVNVTESGIVGDGTVSISGSAVVGLTLTAMTNLLGGSGDITYQWKNSSGDTVIGTDSTYVVNESDIGFTITVTVTRSGLSGPVTSSSTGQVIEQPEYGISLNPSTAHVFPTALAGTPMEPYSVTITNIGKQATGNMTVTFTGSDAASFTTDSELIPTISPGGTASFTVVPATTITTAKNHQAIVTVAVPGQSLINENFIVSFIATLATVTFESAGGGGTFASQTGKCYGDTINNPGDPTFIEGLYPGATVDPNNNFTGWYNGETKWNFASDTITDNTTLTAKFVVQLVDLSELTEPNLVEKAIAYIAENPAAYVLYIADDYNVEPQYPFFNSEIKLTIIGLDSERKINLASNGVLFQTYAGELTLGNNITLVGRSNNSGSPLVEVLDYSTFIMLEGSKIINNNADNSSGGGVKLSVSHGTVVDNSIMFIMYGGIISGNTAARGGGIVVFNGTLRMVNGIIYGNELSTPENLRNNAEYAASIDFIGGVAEYGTFDNVGVWSGTSFPSHGNNNDTYHVVNGVLQP